MHPFKRCALVAFCLLFQAGAAFAADSKNPTEPKFGYVDMARALNDVEEGKIAKAKLKSDFDQKQTKLDKMQNDFKAKKDDFDKRAAMMKPDARQSKQDELQREMMDLQKTFMQLQQELVDSQTAITDDIGKKLRSVVEKIGDRDSYTLVLNIGDTVLYHKRHLDITDDVIRDYNKQYGKK